MDGKRVGAALALAAALAVPSTAQAQTQPVFVNGQAQVVPALNVSAEWIRHRLWVETEFDSDGDGKRDRMHVDVTRPAQTDTEGLKVPVVYEIEPVLRGHGIDGRAVPLEREPGGRRGAAAAHLAAGDRVQPEPDLDLRPARSARGCRAGSPSCTRSRRAPACRRAARRSAARTRTTGAEGGHRLAQRPGEGLHDDRRRRSRSRPTGRPARSA